MNGGGSSLWACLVTQQQEGDSIMFYLVHLKDKDDPVRIEADRMINNDPEAVLFYKSGTGQPVAAFPHANVSYVVEE